MSDMRVGDLNGGHLGLVVTVDDGIARITGPLRGVQFGHDVVTVKTLADGEAQGVPGRAWAYLSIGAWNADVALDASVTIGGE
jgi:hypothetical protein